MLGWSEGAYSSWAAYFSITVLLCTEFPLDRVAMGGWGQMFHLGQLSLNKLNVFSSERREADMI